MIDKSPDEIIILSHHGVPDSYRDHLTKIKVKKE
jgi:hypothetical protein